MSQTCYLQIPYSCIIVPERIYKDWKQEKFLEAKRKRKEKFCTWVNPTQNRVDPTLSRPKKFLESTQRRDPTVKRGTRELSRALFTLCPLPKTLFFTLKSSPIISKQQITSKSWRNGTRESRSQAIRKSLTILFRDQDMYLVLICIWWLSCIFKL